MDRRNLESDYGWTQMEPATMNSNDKKLQAIEYMASLNAKKVILVQKMKATESTDAYINLMRELNFVEHKIECEKKRVGLNKSDVDNPRSEWGRASKQISTAVTRR